MTLDGFLTFLGLIAAALALVSPITRLQLAMSKARLIVWSALFTALVLYLEFFDLLGLHCPPMLDDHCPVLSDKGPVTPQQTAFIAVLLWLGVLTDAWLRPKPSLRTLPALRRLIGRFSESGQYRELVDVVESSVRLVDDCAAGALPSQVRRASWAALQRRPPLPLQDIEETEPDMAAAGFPIRIGSFLKPKLVRFIPSDAKAREAAQDILRTLLSRGPLVDWIAENRPRFGAGLLHLRAHRLDDFSDRFLTWLIAHPGSALYDEISNNRNLGRCGYAISEQNSILQALLSNASVAERLEAYQPIGEHILSILRPANAPDYVQSLNLPYDNHWDSKGRWRDQTFIALRFFDIMVQASACQGVQWHMWLYYMHHVVEHLEKIYEDDGSNEVFGEYPTRAARLIYIAIDNLADWVEIATAVGEDNVHRRPNSAALVHENDNIPKSAALAIGSALRTVVLSERLDERIKRTLLEVALGPLRNSWMRKGHETLRAVLVESVIKGGIVGGGQAYLDLVRALYADIDKPWHDDLDDFREALKIATV